MAVTDFSLKPLAACKNTTTKPKMIRRSLAAATAGLLSQSGQAAEDLYNNWNVDVAYLRYQEADRIKVDSYIGFIRGNLSDTDDIKLGVVLDSMSGVTPTGALPGSSYVSVSGVSGGSISVGSDTSALAPFNDTRLAIDSTWTHAFERTFRAKTSAYISVESDYTAIGGGLMFEREDPQRINTYSFGLGASFDKVSRTGGETPDPLTETSDNLMFGPGKKNSLDALVGLSKVVNKRTVAQFNASYSISLGYHSDPYKVISVADEEDSEATTLFEARPGERSRYVLYSQVKHESVESGADIGLGYRFYFDDWGIQSHTFNFSRATVQNDIIREPFVRLYYQSAADFYHRTIDDGDYLAGLLPDYASADNRLAELVSITLGMKYVVRTAKYGNLNFRLGYYDQTFFDAVWEKNRAFFLTVNLGKEYE